jgi:hypothetical protein
MVEASTWQVRNKQIYVGVLWRVEMGDQINGSLSFLAVVIYVQHKEYIDRIYYWMHARGGGPGDGQGKQAISKGVEG